MKCVVTDGFWQVDPEGDAAALGRAIGGEAALYARTAPEELYGRAEDAEMLVVNKVVIGREQLERLPRLRYVGVAATGYNVVDLEAARRRGVVVTNVPAYSTESVVQTVFAFILEHCQQVAAHAEAVRRGAWTACGRFSFWLSPLHELAGSTLGIVGLGRIGRRVAEVGHAFGMRVVAYTRTRREGLPDWLEQRGTLREVLAESDFVTLHCPLTEATRGLIGSEALSVMRPTAYLVNTSRGPVVDERALAEALNAGRLAGAGVDVLCEEPPSADCPLITARNCRVTPHYAWATEEARRRLWQVVVENARAFASGRPVNVVNG